jgi:hypothetical protein
MVGPGEDLGSYLADSRRLNLWTAAALAQKNAARGGALGAGAAGAPHLVVWVKNTSAAAWPRFTVLSLVALVNFDADTDRAIREALNLPMFTAGAPVAGRAVVVTQEPIAAAEVNKPAPMGLATVVGVTPVKLLSDDPGHHFAEPVPGDLTGLKSAPAGPARVLARYAGGWALVLLGGGGEALLRGKLDGGLTYQGSATMSVWAWDGSAEADTGGNITVYDWLLVSGGSIASGTNVVAAFIGGRWYIIAAACP